MAVDWDKHVLAPCVAVFGEPVLYRPAAGGSFAIIGIFDDAFLKEVLFEDASTGVTEASAVLGVQVSQFATPPAQNDQLVVERTGAAYVVREARFDGHGAVKLMLSRMSSQ